LPERARRRQRRKREAALIILTLADMNESDVPLATIHHEDHTLL
jgi:hypothetical protein